MLKTIVAILVAVPVAIVVIALAVANRAPATLSFDPIQPEQPWLSLTLPFFAWLFITLLTGILIGGVATWASQRRYRREARLKRAEASQWHAKAESEHERAERLVDAMRDQGAIPTRERRRPLAALPSPG